MTTRAMHIFDEWPLADGVRCYAYGFSLRKRPMVRSFLGHDDVRFIRRGHQVPAHAALLLWGSTPPPGGMDESVRLIRIEDGFLRSVGLGAALARPVSWVMDTRGIYYDSTRPSDLEHILQTNAFAPELLARARALREKIVCNGLTKYNVGSQAWQRPAGASRVILVPGQVEADASLKYGAPGVSTNMGLLRQVRAANPDAWIVYKPHPDVVAGLRRKGLNEQNAASLADEVVVDASMSQLLDRVDEVHVLTSLSGFEALLRGRRVTCYGQPFYSGWGLTTDVMPLERRTRRLCIDALVAGTLILYPRYVSHADGSKTTPEQTVDELRAWRSAASGPAAGMRAALLNVVLRAWERLR